MTGRARGRARGRAQGGQATEEPVRRPGAPPSAQSSSAAAQQATAAPPPPAVARGRAVQRGGAQAARPGDVGALAAGVAGMGIEGRDRQRGGVIVQEPRFFDKIIEKTGSRGQPCHVISNYFRMLQDPDYVRYQYHVDFVPDVPNPKLRSSLLNEHKELLGPDKAFDGMQLILPRKLQSPMEVYSTKRSDGEKIRITIKLICELPPNSAPCLQVYNIIFKRILRMLNMRLIGRNYFNPEQRVTIPRHKIEVWPGFVTSILQYENNILLMAEISHIILRTDTVLDVMGDIFRKKEQHYFHDEVKKALIDTIVLTRYNNKTYCVHDVEWNKNPMSTFKLRDGTEITLKDYYRKTYEIDVKDLAQPLIVSKPKKNDRHKDPNAPDEPIYLLPELCTVTGLSDEMRSDFHVMKDLAEHTRLGPDQRTQRLHTLVRSMARNQDVQQELTGWGLQFEKSLIEIQARVLPQEQIYQGGTEIIRYQQKDSDWSREQRGVRMHKAISLENWVLIYTARDTELAEAFYTTLQRVCPPMGMNLKHPRMCPLNNDRNESYLSAMKETVSNSTQMVVCILPNNRKDRYDVIKKFCSVDFPVPSQVVISRTLSKPQQLISVATKIGIQLNVKMGGEVWANPIPLKNLMVCGIDTYHDSAQKGRSAAAFIASYNQTCTRYYSKVSFHMHSMELADNLRKSFTAALRAYHSVNNTLPDSIIIYRDGVGDGQLEMMRDYEIGQMTDCLKDIGENYKPKLTIIVVKKRISTRFFTKMDGSSLVNPIPGTVIDSEVTRPEWYDFFLISQSVRQGTVSPTHYNVVYDTSGLIPDYIQQITYKMTHLYYNWPGTVRVPAPCQYAHKLAFLAGQSLHRPPAEALADKLHFL